MTTAEISDAEFKNTTYVADSNPSLRDGVTGEKLPDWAVIQTFSFVNTMDVLLNFVGESLGDAFWTAFGKHGKYTFLAGFLSAMSLGIYGAVVGMIAWWALPLTVLINTVVYGAALTGMNFLGQFTANMARPLVLKSLTAIGGVFVKGWNLVVSAATGLWGWLKGKPRVEEIKAPDAETMVEEIKANDVDEIISISSLLAAAITKGIACEFPDIAQNLKEDIQAAIIHLENPGRVRELLMLSFARYEAAVAGRRAAVTNVDVQREAARATMQAVAA